MVKKRHIAIIVILILIGGGFFFFAKNKKTVEIKINSQDLFEENNVENNLDPEKKETKLFVSGWLPYWAKEVGVESLQGSDLKLFSEINPFAYGVDTNGKLVDKMQIDSAPWPDLISEAKKENVKIIPTLLWGDAVAMHKTFSNPAFMDQHIKNIISMLDAHNFSGVDIDYEGKDIVDRDNFSAFLKTLHEKLILDKKTLNCTVEARTQDFPPASFTGIRAMSFANDFSALNQDCDSVRVMAYDQVFQIQRANVFTKKGEAPSASNAENQWVEEVVNYALRFVAPEKLILGVSTYGWEFKVEKISGGFRYTRLKSLSYPEFQDIAQKKNIIPMRTAGGELSFAYQAVDGLQLLTVDDAQAVQDKIKIAKKLKIHGISLFKIDGLMDTKIFDILSN